MPLCILQTDPSVVTRLINQGGKPGQVACWSQAVQFSCAPPTHSQTNKVLLSRRGPPGQICTRSFPLKRRFWAFLFNCLSGQAMSCRVHFFVGLFQEAMVRTQPCDINPLSRLFLKLQREIKLNLTSFFNCVSKVKKNENLKQIPHTIQTVLLIGDLQIIL